MSKVLMKGYLDQRPLSSFKTLNFSPETFPSTFPSPFKNVILMFCMGQTNLSPSQQTSLPVQEVEDAVTKDAVTNY